MGKEELPPSLQGPGHHGKDVPHAGGTLHSPTAPRRCHQAALTIHTHLEKEQGLTGSVCTIQGSESAQ